MRLFKFSALSFFAILLVSASFLSLSSCSKEEEETEGAADLSVTVIDVNSVNIVGINVGVYSSEDNAINSSNLLKSTVNTNASGVSKFYSLDAGKAYWIRVQDSKGFAVKETGKLNIGQNSFMMTRD